MKLGVYERQTVFDYNFDNMGDKFSKIPLSFLAGEYELKHRVGQKTSCVLQRNN
jgi:hypothetical protein